MESNYKIVIPEGYEIDEVKNGVINLKKKEVKKKTTPCFPMCWEDTADVYKETNGGVMPEFEFISTNSMVLHCKPIGPLDLEFHNLLPPNSGEAFLTMTQLIFIRNAWWLIEDEYDKECTGTKDTPREWGIVADADGNLSVKLENSLFRFKTQSIALSFLKTFNVMLHNAMKII